MGNFPPMLIAKKTDAITNEIPGPTSVGRALWRAVGRRMSPTRCKLRTASNLGTAGALSVMKARTFRILDTGIYSEPIAKVKWRRC